MKFAVLSLAAAAGLALSADTASAQWVAGQPRYGDPALFEREFVYVVEQSDGRLDLLKPSQFQARVAGGVAKAPTKPEPKPGPKPEPEPREKRLPVPTVTAQAGATKKSRSCSRATMRRKSLRT